MFGGGRFDGFIWKVGSIMTKLSNMLTEEKAREILKAQFGGFNQKQMSFFRTIGGGAGNMPKIPLGQSNPTPASLDLADNTFTAYSSGARACLGTDDISHSYPAFSEPSKIIRAWNAKLAMVAPELRLECNVAPKPRGRAGSIKASQCPSVMDLLTQFGLLGDEEETRENQDNSESAETVQTESHEEKSGRKNRKAS